MAKTKKGPEPNGTLSSDSVRVYEVTSSMLVYAFEPARLHRLKGERVTSAEFVPPEGMTVEQMEQRYLETGGIALVGKEEAVSPPGVP